MSLQRRLDALAKKAREASDLGGEARCHECGWPRAGAPRFVSVRLGEEEEAPLVCPVCERCVDADGRALGGARSIVVLERVGLELR